jgi:hypothetical protein
MAVNVKLLKLLTGEELLAEVLPSIPGGNPRDVTVKNPVRIVVIPNQMDPKTPQVGFAPWAEFSDDKTITLDRSHVVAIMTPIKQFVNQYNTMFGGIINPNGPGLILPGA